MIGSKRASIIVYESLIELSSNSDYGFLSFELIDHFAYSFLSNFQILQDALAIKLPLMP